ncbi:MAG: hypothetical protein RL641_366 [Candidatus Parcubacteria bacterium]|jgi:SET domain-containing protein
MQKFKVKRGVNGLGLFSNVSWKKRDKIIEYIGEIISVEEADRRGGKYLFEIDSKRTIDGKSRKNLARYINHSCVPNCETEIDGKKVFVYALKKIAPHDELTYDYGKEYFDEYIKPKGCGCPKHKLKTNVKSAKK